jgi:hypothetical protein
METPDGDPVVYTEEMAAEDDELLANAPTPLSTSTGGRLTRELFNYFLSKFATREEALKTLQEMGQVDEHGNLTPPYRPVNDPDNV